jgi:hypothetical protein
MKPYLFALTGLGLGLAIGWCAHPITVVPALLKAAAQADGFEGGNYIRHAIIGNVTNVMIAPDHVAVAGTKGTRQWWP